MSKLNINKNLLFIIVFAYLQIFFNGNIINAQTVIDTIDVGNSPRGIAVNPTTNLIYVTNMRDDNVSVIDGVTHEVVTNIAVGNAPLGIGVDPSINQIYVGDGNGISVIDGDINQVITTIELIEAEAGFFLPTCPTPKPILRPGLSLPDQFSPILPSLPCVSDLAESAQVVEVNPITNFVYVAKANSGNICCTNNIWVIDGKTNSVIENIKLPAVNSPTNLEIDGLGINPLTHTIYVLSREGINVLDGNTNQTIKTIQHTARSLDINPMTDRLYLTNCVVSVIDDITNSVIATVGEEGNGLSDIGINPTTNHIFVDDPGANRVKVIDGLTNEIITNIENVHRPDKIAVNSNTGLVYVLSVDHDLPSLEQVTVIQDVALTTTEPPPTLRADFLVKIVPEGLASPCSINTCNTSLSVQFIDISTDNPTNWLWDFGDGSTSSEQNPFHTYDEGTFDVKLTVEGTSDISIKERKGFVVVKDCQIPTVGPVQTPNPSSGQPKSTPTLHGTPVSTPTPTVSDTPLLNPEELVTEIKVTPDSSNKSIKFKKAIVTVSDSSGFPVSSARINASAKGPGSRVTPSSRITGIDGKAKFKFRFGFISNNGEIRFNLNGLNATITQE